MNDMGISSTPESMEAPLHTSAASQHSGVASYRMDIDGLRGFAVLGVLLFHISGAILPGGFVGVDIFFVISGFLITSIILLEQRRENFSYIKFYRRRAIRLLPALLVTFAACFLFALIVYSPFNLDQFGKQLVYAVFGLGNFYSAQGTNYFGSDISATPLLHLWSLGVEEQFYLFWPTILLVLAAWRPIFSLMAILLIAAVSLGFSEHALASNPLAAYFLPQFRIFELAAGALIAVGQLNFRHKLPESPSTCNAVSFISLGLMIGPMLLMNESTPFPGFNAAIPCVGAALFLANQKTAFGNRIMTFRPLVSLGLISYPLYLLHLPVLSAAQHLGYGENLWVSALLIAFVAVPAAWVVYRYLEVPLRRAAKAGSTNPIARKTTNRYVIAMAWAMLAFAGAGMLMAKTQGLPQRFEVLNPYAANLNENRKRPLFKVPNKLVNLDEKEQKSVLIFGDSLMQDYAPAMVGALGMELADVDLVTKAGCAFVKGIDAVPFDNPVKCNSLRKQLYSLEGPWDTVIFTQSWTGYIGRLLNAPTDVAENSAERWMPFLESTLDYFSSRSREIIVIGSHVGVINTEKLKPNLFTSQDGYTEKLSELSVENADELTKNRSLFDAIAERDNVTIVHPEDLWGGVEWIFHDGKLSYFYDSFHMTVASVDYVERRLRAILAQGSGAE